MTPNTHQQTPFDDPRKRPDFQPSLYPKANGRVATPLATTPMNPGRVVAPSTTAPSSDTAERNERVIVEFLAAYYDINCEHRKLIEARAMAEPVERLAREQECLQAIEKSLIQRDALEDQYAPLGIIAEPVARDGFTVDVKFTFGSVNAAGRLRAAPLSSSTIIPIRLPPGVKLENLTLPDETAPQKS